MKKYKVTIPCNYVIGYLRYGHFEGEVEANSIEEVKAMFTKADSLIDLDLCIDDYSVEDYEANFDEMEIEE